jgi:heme/copper-type cytochrome/quinol oxidase subunit 1
MQPFMTAPADHRDELVHVAFGLAAVLPVLVVLGLVADTARRGMGNLDAMPSTMLLGAVGALLLVEGAVVTGALRVIEPFELLERSTTTALFNGAVVASLLAGLAGLWYWAPKILGTTLAEGPGRLAALALIVGGVVLVAPDAISGFFGAPDVMLAEPDESIVDALDVVSLIGSIVVALGVLVGVLVAAAALRRGRPGADADPWGGHTLEWSTPSPPPSGNFSEQPARVVSERPLLDQRSEGEGS